MTMISILSQLIALAVAVGAGDRFCTSLGTLIAQWKEERIVAKEVSFPQATRGLSVFGILTRPGEERLGLFEHALHLERDQETPSWFRSSELRRKLQATALEDFRSAKQQLASQGTGSVPERGSDGFRTAAEAIAAALRSGQRGPSWSSGQLAPVCLQALLEADESELAALWAGSFVRFGRTEKGLERQFKTGALRQIEGYLALMQSADQASGLPPEERIEPAAVGVRISRDNDKWTVIARAFDQMNRVKDTFGLQAELKAAPRYALDDEKMRRIRSVQVRWPASVLALSRAAAPGSGQPAGQVGAEISASSVRAFAKSPWSFLAGPIQDALHDAGFEEALVVCEERWILPLIRSAGVGKWQLFEVLAAASEVAPVEVLEIDGVIVIRPRNLLASESSTWNADPAVRYVDSVGARYQESIDDFVALSGAAGSPDLYVLCQATRRLSQRSGVELLSDTPPLRLCQMLLQRDYWTRVRAGEAVSILDTAEDLTSARDIIEEWLPFIDAVEQGPNPRPALMAAEEFLSQATFSLDSDQREQFSPMDDLGTGALPVRFDPREYGSFLRRILPPDLDDSAVLAQYAYRVSVSRLRLKCSFRNGQAVFVPFGTRPTRAPSPQALSSLSKEQIDAILRGYRGTIPLGGIDR
ncbi:MAG: hypothetical protein UZ18_ATM001000338 [Armatimonadetes bacterium OLB18]|nr:MAG: hypothetical protein UZ18_ATM001000338 [Armatimonadetes bacterium OLB18]